MIETSRLLIRPFKKTDAQDLFDYLSLPITYVFEPGEPVTLEQAAQMCDERSMGHSFFAVVLKSENKMIGHLYFEQQQPLEWLTWELGYIFNPVYQQRGYASEAAAALVDHAFRELHAHRILARCNPDNVASWKLLEKVGFVREGHFKKVAFFRRDEEGKPIWTDAYEYSLVNPRN